MLKLLRYLLCKHKILNRDPQLQKARCGGHTPATLAGLAEAGALSSDTDGLKKARWTVTEEDTHHHL